MLNLEIYEEDYMSLGKKIKMYRKNKNLSQKNLAEKVGVSRQTLTKWESNKSAPSTENLITVADVLDVPMNDLISDNPISESNETNRGIIEIGYTLSGVAAIFYYGLITDSTFLTISFGVLSFIGSIILLVFTWTSYSEKTRVKVLTSNFIYLIIINTLGILTKFYGGIIVFILILIVISLYKKFLKKFELKS